MKDDRLISLNAAIDALNQRWGTCILGDDIADGCAKVLNALPSAQPGWIPTSERLPKKDGDYLVTTYSGQIARYIFIGGSSEEYWRRCATAWMPLPEPWEGNTDAR